MSSQHVCSTGGARQYSPAKKQQTAKKPATGMTQRKFVVHFLHSCPEQTHP